MSDLPLSIAQRMLADGIPLTLLLDLHDPETMREELAAELLASDVAQTPTPTPTVSAERSVRSA